MADPEIHEGIGEGVTRKDAERATRAFEPYVPASRTLPEFTLRAVLTGIVLGILFGAANAYLGLRVGLTISTSIPVAVLTVAAFRALHRTRGGSSILEANTSQTVGSASSSVASGVIFTLPALFLWGLDPTLLRMTLLALVGGVMGILFMVPLRRFLIEREHETLPYPEGTACAEVLKASEAGGARARPVFLGLAAGALLKFLTAWAHVLRDQVSVRLPWPRKAEIGTEISAALFGVGFILGPRIAAVMVGGGLLAWLVIIPAIDWWGAGRLVPLYPETELLISEMEPGGRNGLWSRYVRYIGAGAVATGGLVTLIRSIPTMVESFRIGARQLRERLGAAADAPEEPRTGRDLPLKAIGLGLLALVGILTLAPQTFGPLGGFPVRLVAAVLVVVCAFFFVTVSSRIVGLVGVTSNPTSGMTIASLMLTASVFLLLGWTGDLGKVAALVVGCVVAIAASIAGDTSQDLKTGFLLGATPRNQQMGEILGVLTSAAFVCYTVIVLDRAFELGSEELAAPQATLMRLVIDGVLEQSLPWAMVLIGVGIALAAEAFRIPSLPFAVGVYLPVSTMVPVFLGGLLRWWVSRRAPSEDEREERVQRGVLFGSGLVGGEGILGVGIAAGAVITSQAPEGIGPEWAGPLAPWLAVGGLALLAFSFWRLARGRAGGRET
ncbi:MAG TPA: oligopeptide transporter, OPT family [Thermoanaerobaculia bacterium]|nr:oligopeptide transporter, OPT family [Thermoanaerobaculia bacterium]